MGFIFSRAAPVRYEKLIKNPKLYEEPEGTEPPPFWIRALLFFTCTGVSFAHGSNDGQKGMGLIMLILIGTVPTAYALNHAVANQEVQNFIAISEKAEQTLEKYAGQVNNVATARPFPRKPNRTTGCPQSSFRWKRDLDSEDRP